MLMLMGQVKRMLCLMYGNCPSHRLDNMKEKALKRKVCTSRSWSDGNVIRIANIDLVLDLYKKRNLQGVPKKVADRNFEGCVWKSGFGPKWPGLTQMVVVQKFTQLTPAYKFWWQLFMGHPVNLI